VSEKKYEYVPVKIPVDLAEEMDKLKGRYGFRSRGEIAKEAIRRLITLFKEPSDDIAEVIKESLRTKPKDWRVAIGTELLSADEVIRRMDKDEKFRDEIVKSVVGLSIDLLKRK